jgi:hypothetical protein
LQTVTLQDHCALGDSKIKETILNNKHNLSEITANEYTKVSSAEGSKVTRNATEDIDGILKEATNKNVYAISAQWEGKNLTLNSLFFGDDATRAELSIYDIINDRTIGYNPVIATNMEEVNDFAKSSINLSVGTTVYIVLASKNSQPKYEFIALGSPLNTDIVKEVSCDCWDSLYYLATNEACFDFITGEFDIASA